MSNQFKLLTSTGEQPIHVQTNPFKPHYHPPYASPHKDATYAARATQGHSTVSQDSGTYLDTGNASNSTYSTYATGIARFSEHWMTEQPPCQGKSLAPLSVGESRCGRDDECDAVNAAIIPEQWKVDAPRYHGKELAPISVGESGHGRDPECDAANAAIAEKLDVFGEAV